MVFLWFLYKAGLFKILENEMSPVLFQLVLSFFVVYLREVFAEFESESIQILVERKVFNQSLEF